RAHAHPALPEQRRHRVRRHASVGSHGRDVGDRLVVEDVEHVVRDLARRARRHQNVPPSTPIHWSFTYRAASETHHATTSATSSGLHTCPNGIRWSSEWMSSPAPIAAFASRRPISVSTSPGATTFTWMPCLRSSLARVRASASIDALPTL